MFSSRNRQHYQVIDDDFNEEDILQNGAQNLRSFPRRTPFGLGSEAAPLVNNTSRASVAFRPEQSEREREETIAPLLISSSGEERHRWDHVKDLDDFFRRIYDYHQGGGFTCLFFASIWALVQFLFVVFVSTFFLQCIDYDILFNKKLPPNYNVSEPFKKRYFGDAMVKDCASHLSPFMVICIVAAVVYWVFMVVRTTVHLLKLNEIQQFYSRVLYIEDADLVNTPWEAVVSAVCTAQGRVEVFVSDRHISSIDIYNRILRFKNYMVALVTQELLPPILSVPYVGDVRYMSDQLKLNLEWLLFLGFCSPFKGSYTLQDEYRHRENLEELASSMEKTVTYVGLANLVLSPLIFIYQCFYYLFTAADLTKRDTSALGNRAYTNYGRYRVRHFNELEHELRARLNRSHAYATAYVAQFNSPLVVVFARNVSFIAACIFAPLTVLTVWDEDVLQTEHVLTVLTLCGVVALVCRSLIPDENMVWQPEQWLTLVTAELHYVPDHWKENAHDIRVMREFESLFRLRALNLLEEITSPFVTPFVLLFHIRPLCRAILSFIAENTIREDGLGDICSFAMLDVEKHGDPSWHQLGDKQATVQPSGEKAHDGKTELSVLQFATRHPEWMPPVASAQFLRRFQSRMGHDASTFNSHTGGRNVLAESVHTLLATPLTTTTMGGVVGAMRVGGRVAESGMREGCGLERSLRQSGQDSIVESLRCRPGAEMRVSALFLRGMRSERNNTNYASMGPTDDAFFALPIDNAVSRVATVMEEENEEEDHPPRVHHVQEDEEDERPPTDFFA